MKHFDVQCIEIAAGYDVAFDYISDSRNLSEWTSAFQSVSDNRAILQTPSGSVEVELVVDHSREKGSIDWLMIFPDGSRATAYSRLVRVGDRLNAYSFVLTPPPVSLEQLEGTLEQQSQILQEELGRLQNILEGK